MQQGRKPSWRQEGAPRKPTNVSLPQDLLDEAKRLNLNVSQACEVGLQKAVSQTKNERWLEENQKALQQWNEWVEKNGLPLARFRQF
jgi:antitoxin CcdA